MLAKILRWGNSFGIRLSKQEAQREGLAPGQEVDVEIRPRPVRKIDLSHLRKFDLGGDLSVRHDEFDWA